MARQAGRQVVEEGRRRRHRPGGADRWRVRCPATARRRRRRSRSTTQEGVADDADHAVVGRQADAGARRRTTIGVARQLDGEVHRLAGHRGRQTIGRDAHRRRASAERWPRSEARCRPGGRRGRRRWRERARGQRSAGSTSMPDHVIGSKMASVRADHVATHPETCESRCRAAPPLVPSADGWISPRERRSRRPGRRRHRRARPPDHRIPAAGWAPAVHADRRRAGRQRGRGAGTHQPAHRARRPADRRRRGPAQAGLPPDGHDRRALRRRAADGRGRGDRHAARRSSTSSPRPAPTISWSRRSARTARRSWRS